MKAYGAANNASDPAAMCSPPGRRCLARFLQRQGGPPVRGDDRGLGHRRHGWSGVLIAAQLYWPTIGEGIPWLSYGRLRPLHTNAVIFAFGGSALFATSLHVVQRTCHVRLISDRLGVLRVLGLAGGDRGRRASPCRWA